MSPHGHFGRVMDQFELAGLRFEDLPGLAMFDPNLKQGVIVALSISLLSGNGSKFLVGRIVGRGDIMTQKECVRYDVA